MGRVNFRQQLPSTLKHEEAKYLIKLNNNFFNLIIINKKVRRYSVAVSTRGFDPRNPGSIPGIAFLFFILLFVLFCLFCFVFLFAWRIRACLS